MTGTRKIVLGGVFGALIALTTAYLKIPLGMGYIHLGDGLIFASVGALGFAAAIPAAVGSALADLMAGYQAYIPATFVIKGLMALVAAMIVRGAKGRLAFLAFVPAALLMMAGYFAFECVLYSPQTALAAIAGNAVQASAGVAVGAVLLPAVKKSLK